MKSSGTGTLASRDWFPEQARAADCAAVARALVELSVFLAMWEKFYMRYVIYTVVSKIDRFSSKKQAKSMFCVKEVQHFPAARAKSDAKGKKTLNFYRITKIFTQSINFFTQDEKKNCC